MKLLKNTLAISFTILCCSSNGQTTGKKITADFDGDGKKEIATLIKTKEIEGNPLEDGTPAAFEIRFSNKRLSVIKIETNASLVAEGDLNNDGSDDFSIFQSPMNGCTWSMTTFSWNNGKWANLVPTFLVPTACAPISQIAVQQMVFKEKGKICYFRKDADVPGRLIKTLVK